MMRRRLIRIGFLFGTACLLGLVILGYLGAGRLLSPDRRVLQDYHRSILGNPERYGLVITAYEGPHATPCLMVEPSATPGEAKKGRLARELLSQKGAQPAPWGKSAEP